MNRVSASGSGPVLELRGLRKAFGALVVAADVDLSVMPGECHALIGPNGAGKTTLVHQIAGSSLPDAGAIFLGGHDVTLMPAHARAAMGLARSFQITSVIPDLSALGNVALAAQAKARHPLSFFRHAARDTALNASAMQGLERVGLGQRSHIRASALAHGEKRALEVAMALASNPEIILLDEPLAGMGREESRAMIGLLGRLKGTVALLLVEHDMNAVFQLADRVSVLVAGRIIASGTADDVRGNAAVKAAYLGTGEGQEVP